MPTPLPPHLSRSSLRMLQLSFVTPRVCRGPGCICLNHEERRALRRVGKIVRQWKRQARREAGTHGPRKAGTKARKPA